MFDYMTAQITAEKWNILLRWVQRLCKENRKKGVMNINRVLLISQDAVKQEDAQKGKIEIFQKTCKVFGSAKSYK